MVLRGQKKEYIDTCVIRTHAPEGIRSNARTEPKEGGGIAGERLNHSAKVPG